MNNASNDLTFNSIFQHAQRGEYYQIQSPQELWRNTYDQPAGVWVHLNGIQRFIRYLCQCFSLLNTSEEECVRRSLHSLFDCVNGISKTSQAAFNDFIEFMGEIANNEEESKEEDEDEDIEFIMDNFWVNVSIFSEENQRIFHNILGEESNRESISYRMNCLFSRMALAQGAMPVKGYTVFKVQNN